QWSLIMEGLARALAKSDESAQADKLITDPKKYLDGRRKAEEMVKRAMMVMESDLLGAFAPLHLPSRKLTKKGETMATSIRVKGEGAMREYGKGNGIHR
ncbi:hypothetical protein PENTCL1PPCAC_21870, partial [Pristionchus entomophagus]